MSVTAFQISRRPIVTAAGMAAPRRGGAPLPQTTDEPNEKYREAHIWYDNEKKDICTAYKLLIADVIDGKLRAVPRAVMAPGPVPRQGRRRLPLTRDAAHTVITATPGLIPLGCYRDRDVVIDVFDTGDGRSASVGVFGEVIAGGAAIVGSS
jgi:hypothetical protein